MPTALPHVDPADFSPAVYHGPPAVPGRVWHYTNGHRARRICADGALKPMPQQDVAGGTALGKRELLWFSRNPVWEPAACHAFSALSFEWNGVRCPKALTFEGMQHNGVKLARFAVHESQAPYSHQAGFRLAGFSTHASRLLARAGEMLGGNVDDWRGTLEPVLQADWLAIEVWNRAQCLWEVVWP